MIGILAHVFNYNYTVLIRLIHIVKMCQNYFKKSTVVGIYLLQLLSICEVYSATFPNQTLTAHLTLNGQLIERWFNSTGHLNGCRVYGHRRTSEMAVESIPRDNVFMVNEERFQQLLSDCPVQETTRHDRRARRAIFPGTKWCGTSNVARSPMELGFNKRTDRCCRDHDQCYISIRPGETKYNITNSEIATVVSCQCDRDFYDCLKSVNTFSSKTVGMIFFNMVKMPCIEESFPERCNGFWFWKRCRKDNTQEKRLRLIQSNFVF